MKALHSLVTLGTHALKGELGRFRFRSNALFDETAPRERLKQQQLSKLRIALAHAGRNVPYWRRVFLETGFDPTELSSFEDLEKLPILTKESIRAHRSEMIADGFSSRDLVSLKTAGATGEPLELFIDRPSLERQMSIDLRVFSRVGVSTGTRLAKILPYGRSHDLANTFASLTGRLFLDSSRAGDDDMERWYSVLRRHHIQALCGHASSIYHFARYIQWYGYELPDVRRVCVTSDRLTSQMRQVISSVFRTPIIYMYGRIETVRLASDCLGSSMHEELDAGVLEFVDHDLVTPYKRILLTTLHNTAMPLIRYDLGDIGVRSDSFCPCGSHLPTICVEPAKSEHLYELPDGDRIHTSVFTKSLYRIPDLEVFQIRARRGGLVDYSVVPQKGREGHIRQHLEAAVRQCENTLNGRVHIRIHVVDEIPSSPGIRPVVICDNKS